MDNSKLPWAILFLGITAVSWVIAWKVSIWTIKKYFPKPNLVKNDLERNVSTRSLLEMKKLFDEKLITQAEFDEYKQKHLGKLKAS